MLHIYWKTLSAPDVRTQFYIFHITPSMVKILIELVGQLRIFVLRLFINRSQEDHLFAYYSVSGPVNFAILSKETYTFLLLGNSWLPCPTNKYMVSKHTSIGALVTFGD